MQTLMATVGTMEEKNGGPDAKLWPIKPKKDEDLGQGYSCELTNQSAKALPNVELKMELNFFEVVQTTGSAKFGGPPATLCRLRTHSW